MSQPLGTRRCVCAALTIAWLGVNGVNNLASAFDDTGLAIWLDAGDINGDGSPDSISQGTSIPLWADKSGQGNNAFQAPAGDPAGGYPSASGGLLRAEMYGPLPPAPLYNNVDSLTPSGLPAVRFNTCNEATFPGCNVPPPTYPTQTGLMTNFHAHPDPTMVVDDGHPAAPDLTIAVVVRPTLINDFHAIWSFEGDLGGHSRSLGVIPNFDGKSGLLTDGGARILYEDPLDKWFVLIQSYDFDGTPSDPTPQPTKLYINSPTPIVASGPESIQGEFDAPMTIGFFPQDVVNGHNITMLLSEFLVFKRTLTDAETNSLGFELAQKYGVATSFTAPVLGDYNNNGIVDTADYTVWRDHLGQSFALPNEDPGSTAGMVTTEDYDYWKAHFGATAGGGSRSSGAAPEPSSWVMLLIAASWPGIGRTRRISTGTASVPEERQ